MRLLARALRKRLATNFLERWGNKEGNKDEASRWEFLKGLSPKTQWDVIAFRAKIRFSRVGRERFEFEFQVNKVTMDF